MTDTAQLLVTVNVQGDSIRVKDLERIVANTLKRLPTKRIDPSSVQVAWHSKEPPAWKPQSFPSGSQ